MRLKKLRESPRKLPKGTPEKEEVEKKPQKVLLKKFIVDEHNDFHPVKKRKRVTKRNAVAPLGLDPLPHPSTSSLSSSSSQPGGGSFSFSLKDPISKPPTHNLFASPTKKPPTKTIVNPLAGLEKQDAELESPRKASRTPFCGLKPNITHISTNFLHSNIHQIGHYFRSPDTALKRPLKRSISGNCIKNLVDAAVFSPEKRLKNVDEEEEENQEQWADEGQKRKKAKLDEGSNFVRLNMKQKTFTRQANKLKGKALKRFLWKKKQKQ